MINTTRLSLLALILSFSLFSCEKPEDKPAELMVLGWNDLVPADWSVENIISEYNSNDISDDDPRALELMEKIQEFMKNAPVVEELDGKQVKLPGYVVPLELNATHIQEFLLVPYFGACIHSPPPPSNQTIYVVTPKDKSYAGKLYDTVWVTGKMKIEHTSKDLGDAGYRIDVSSITPYREPAR